MTLEAEYSYDDDRKMKTTQTVPRRGTRAHSVVTSMTKRPPVRETHNLEVCPSKDLFFIK